MLFLGYGQTLVDDRNHAVDLFACHDERWAEMHRHEDAGEEPTLLHQLDEAPAEGMGRRGRAQAEWLERARREL